MRRDIVFVMNESTSLSIMGRQMVPYLAMSLSFSTAWSLNLLRSRSPEASLRIFSSFALREVDRREVATEPPEMDRAVKFSRYVDRGVADMVLATL